MAKRVMKWTEANAILTCEHQDSEKVQDFDLSVLFEDFNEYGPVQKYLVVYGVKQVLADCTARPSDQTLTPDERYDTVQARWELWLSGKVKEEGITRQTGIAKNDFVEKFVTMGDPVREFMLATWPDECVKFGLTLDMPRPEKKAE